MIQQTEPYQPGPEKKFFFKFYDEVGQISPTIFGLRGLGFTLGR